MNIKKAIEFAQERSIQYCMEVGGYPDDIDGETIPGYVITAGLDDGKDRLAPILTIMTEDEFIAEQLEWQQWLDEML
jgi:hypothetical protein